MFSEDFAFKCSGVGPTVFRSKERTVNPYGHEMLDQFKVWRHLQRGGTYHIMGVSKCSTNGPQDGEESVVYFSIDYQELHHRRIDEFLDGRFEPVKPKEQ